MIIHLGETTKFRITEAVFRFGADVRIGDDLRQAQLRLIRDGEAVVHSQEPSQQSLLDTVSADEQHEDQPTLWEDEA